MDLIKIVEVGERLGYKDESLQQFVQSERVKQETLLKQKLERDERIAERELRKIEAENREKQAEREHSIELASKERELLELKAKVGGDLKGDVSKSISTGPKIKLPPFDDHRDNLDSYIERFERYVSSRKIVRTQWAVELSALLQGKALQVYTRMPVEDALEYDKLKTALLKRFQMTEDGYRVKFRTCRPEKGETPTQFATRLSSYLDKWTDLSEITKDYEGFFDLIMREQFVQSCSKEMAVFLKEHECKSIHEMAEIAERFTDARGLSSFCNSSKSRTNEYKSNYDHTKQVTGKNVGSNNSVSENRRCFICNDPSHIAKTCPKRSQKSQQHVKAKVHGLVAGKKEYQKKGRLDQHSEEDGNVSCYVGELQKCCVGSKGRVALKCGHEVNVLNLAYKSKDLDYDGPMPVCEGLAMGSKVLVLRDTGCNSGVIRKELVDKTLLTGEKQNCLLIDGTIRKFPTATINVDTPYYSGEMKVLCMENPVYDLIIGNISGAREPDDPDPNWIAKDNRDNLPTEITSEKRKVKVQKTVDIEMNEAQGVETRAMQARKNKPVHSLNVPSPISQISPSEFLDQQKQDSSITYLWKKASNQDVLGKYKFVVKNEFLKRTLVVQDQNNNKTDQVVVPTIYRKQIMKLAYESLLSGHLGISRTYDKILNHFYWPGIHQDVVHYCRSCDICQKTIQKGKVSQVPLGKVPLIDTPFKRVAIDLVGPIYPPSEKGNRYILTLIDYATRYPEATALKNIETVTIAEALVDMYARVGIPSEILSDQGSQFTSDLMKEVSRLLSIKQLTSSPYHPQNNGLIERFHSTLKMMLKRMCSERPRDWDRYLSAVLFAYREAPQESLGFSPFELLYGRSVRGPLSVLRELLTKEEPNVEIKSTYQYVVDLKEKLSETCDLAQKMLSKSSARYKKYYDQKKRSRLLKVGDQVLVLLPTDRNKLLLQWKGPYEVTSKLSDLDYKVHMKGKDKTYHINLLKKYITREDEVKTTSGLLELVTPPEECQNIGNSLTCQEQDTDSNDLQDLNEGFPNIDSMPNLSHKESLKDVNVSGNLTPNQSDQVINLLGNYSTILTDVPLKTDVIQCQIKLTTDDPIRSRPYNVPYSVRETMKEEIKKMLDMGIIERSDSAFASPVVMIPKKDKTVRFCVDYRKVNKITVFDPEPMPNPEDLFVQLSSSKYFSKIDLTKGYWQIPMADESKMVTAFVTPEGQYQFLFMPFGLVCAPSIFTRLMRKLFGNVRNVVNYIDDILVHTETFDQHMQTLKKVFQILFEANLSARPSKCFIGYDSVEFLGHQITPGKIGTNPELLKKIQNCPIPTTKKEVRSFIGLTSYYRKFVPNFSEVALPLTDLTRKGNPNKVNWGEAQDKAYRTLKDLLSNPPILHLPDFSKTFVLRVDASDRGIGSVLLQEYDSMSFPVAYASRKLLKREQNYSTIERECLAIVWAVHKFEMYLFGREFIIQTDHHPLVYINRSKVMNKRIMGWAMYLQEFRFHIESIPGKLNYGPDFLSRIPQPN